MRTIIALVFLCLGSLVCNPAIAQQSFEDFYGPMFVEKIDTLKAKGHITIGGGNFNVGLSYDRLFSCLICIKT